MESRPAKEDIDISAFTADAVLGRVADAEKKSEAPKKNPVLDKQIVEATKVDAKLSLERQKQKLKEEEKHAQDVEEAAKKEPLKKIQRYFDRFPELLERVPKLSKNPGLVEINETLRVIRDEMDCARSLQRLNQYVDYGFMTLENFWGDGSTMTALPERARLNLNNLTALYRGGKFQEDLEPILQELDIEYPWLGRQGLLLRALGTLTTIATKVHIFNINPAARKLLNLSEHAPVDVDVSDL